MGRDDRQSIPRGGLEPKVPRHYVTPEEPPQLTVMTWNLYFGTDLAPVLEAADANELMARVAAAFNRAQSTDFRSRAIAWADKIQAASPDLIGLQEVAIFRIQSPTDALPEQPPPPPNATLVHTDMLDLLLAELESRGLDYVAVTSQVGQDVEAPGVFPAPGNPPFRVDDIRLTQREVILARKSGELRLTNVQGGRYDNRAKVMTKVGAKVQLWWAWASVDVTFRERTFRFATTHLDPEFEALQWKQAEEFLSGPGDTTLPVVWVGDFNSDADGTSFIGPPPATDTYQKLLQSGFSDAWTANIPDRPGFTCCQLPSLKNRESQLSQRIDFVLYRGSVSVLNSSTFGDDPADRTASGLWPSDHAGVVVTLQL